MTAEGNNSIRSPFTYGRTAHDDEIWRNAMRELDPGFVKPQHVTPKPAERHILPLTQTRYARQKARVYARIHAGKEQFRQANAECGKPIRVVVKEHTDPQHFSDVVIFGIANTVKTNRKRNGFFINNSTGEHFIHWKKIQKVEVIDSD